MIIDTQLKRFPFQVSGIADNSRDVRKGYLFVAIKGLTVDAHQFIPEAVKRGATVVVGEKDFNDLNISPKKARYIKVTDSRKALSLLASAWYGNPANKLRLIGVTGTDGKTTTASMIWWILQKSGLKVGLISTVSAKIGNKEYDTGFHVTNPEPLALQRFLKKMVDSGCEYAVLEVTSHGLDQKRVYGINFDVGVLTNITHEHLDYHKTFDAYRRAKLKLFKNSKVAVLNKNDKNSNWVRKNIGAKTIFYKPDLMAKVFTETHNQENAAAAIAVARYINVSKKEILSALNCFPGVEGRMQEVKNNKGIKIIIDFAHTPNSLKCVLINLRKSSKGKLISVFGCAGERDSAKRKIMGGLSASIADLSIFTAEDPRSEKIKDILLEMEKGVLRKNIDKYLSFPERGDAIYYAINSVAKKGDTVIICGKGHEKSMSYYGVEYPWSDKVAVLSALEGKSKRIPWRENIYKGKNVAILGLGLEGKDLANYLVKIGANVTIRDQKPENELDLSKIPSEKIRFMCGSKYLVGLNQHEFIFRSPGIYRYKKELVYAEKKGVVISSAIKLFFDFCSARIIGVTGTKGKGTTSTLVYQIIKNSGKDVYLAGNIGRPCLNLLSELRADSWVVLELSSFQLIDLEKSPHISVVLNITSDHMDWHKNLREYRESKKNIVKYQTSKDYSVINADYHSSKVFSQNTFAKLYYFSRNKKVCGAYVTGDSIYLNFGEKILIGNIKKLLLRGKHNLENITAAICAAYLSEAEVQEIKNTIFEFKGLEHRLELVRKIKGVSFYNDSFSTNPQTTVAAVDSFKESLTLILGGYNKGLDYGTLIKKISKAKNLKNIILIGDLSTDLNKLLLKSNFKGKIIELKRASMRKIIRNCFKITDPGGVVLLSPAAASFDMFKDYKDRGEKFKSTVSKFNF
ncbi:MAG: UDP-N-acetylmuramyl-tripeptide synthetase [Candidatus Woesebacteria bacterium GW2011_GWB1_43_14]|uniref:Multifunctional fusion protein n=1 Tax=Candidatus Woesebacteria bacterium GW2011_GWB1_43_14 TaxID=1618578 RepID=A0A0G1GE62_9BACT|nr:MAG: UDP-N-acetylmuramyl-tripeptide synthetase [Candidatus Woesebacteria bacterium GW2011_GWA1_39_11b]KKS78430.1 MAG: UDP-N-acetylmuramyl-tripeptide synthetase [Candidatus Woesebacteria bacterium GW2011_GWC1_42_9]KKS97153.1 MAG: UDP-N-acetylmuramyl-tripeptide synthetase [Candidatus Woesebacteria bacterium GW2011_GWB1_43_14]